MEPNYYPGRFSDERGYIPTRMQAEIQQGGYPVQGLSHPSADRPFHFRAGTSEDMIRKLLAMGRASDMERAKRPEKLPGEY